MTLTNTLSELYDKGFSAGYKFAMEQADGPAIEHPNGYKSWFLNGKLHRDDGPAIEYVNGRKKWYLNGKLHREEKGTS